MSYVKMNYPTEKPKFYAMVNQLLSTLMQDEKICTTSMANASAILFDALDDVNWVGFYMRKDDTLYLAPFQGKQACTTIKIGRGVCGTAFATKEIQLVDDVHLFEGHIACDSQSASEIVIPLILNDEVIGVLDIDSPIKARFDNDDLKGLSEFCDILLKSVDFSNYVIS